MKRPFRVLPVVAGAIAGAVVAVIVATSGSSSPTVTTVVRPASGASLPTSLTSTRGLTVNQIYRQAGPGVVDITVTSQSSNGGFFGGNQQTQGEGAGVVYDTKGDILTD